MPGAESGEATGSSSPGLGAQELPPHEVAVGLLDGSSSSGPHGLHIAGWRCDSDRPRTSKGAPSHALWKGVSFSGIPPSG